MENLISELAEFAGGLLPLTIAFIVFLSGFELGKKHFIETETDYDQEPL